MFHSNRRIAQRLCALMLMLVLPFQGLALAAPLADQPVFSNSTAAGNLALALSVEWPTASRTAHTDNYTNTAAFLGYFDTEKCYRYVQDTTANTTAGGIVIPAGYGDQSYFTPIGLATNRTCSGAWSGNFLNWATTAAIDPFRWAMTGGRRVVDTATTTILEKGWHSGQGLFNDRSLPQQFIAGATPFTNAGSLGISINGRGFAMRLTPVTGIRGDYYANTINQNPAGTPTYTNYNDSVNYNWGQGGPGNGVGTDNFTAIWTVNFPAPSTGTYTFRTTSDDGVLLSINGVLRVNNWNDHSATVNTTVGISFNAGDNIQVQMKYYERGGDAVAKLEMLQPGGSWDVLSNQLAPTQDYTVRVKVCDPSSGAGGVESNCKQYGSNWKPEGLVQQYSNDIRFSAFGYLNDGAALRDGGVMRARQKFVGPTNPVPGQPSVTNGAAEWSSTDGTFVRNPDTADATSTTTNTGIAIADSGVINYLNKFGQIYPGNYKSYDPVNELYYATLRYFRALGNVPEWSNMTTTDTNARRTQLDGFPVITNWDDPIQYSCQRNFVLGIGDIYTWNDKNVPGNNTGTDSEPTKPALIANDNSVDSVVATNRVGFLQNKVDASVSTNLASVATGAGASRYYMAGLAFDANTKDIRPDDASKPQTVGKQTVQTYWVDVLEQPFQSNNKFYLAAKFGGLNVPQGFDPYTFAGTIPQDWWSTNGDTLTDNRNGAQQPRPDNYFTAGRPDTMVAGLRQAFDSIANKSKGAFSSVVSLVGRQVTTDSDVSYATQYNPANWTGELTATQISFAADGTPTANSTPAWTTTTTFENQLGTGTTDTGWSTARQVVTWTGTAGVPFRYASLTSAQQTALDTSYVSGNDGSNYLQWLRGDRSREGLGYRIRSITTTDSSGNAVQQSRRLGDIVDSKVTVVGPPAASYSDAANPGYSAYRQGKASRATMLYVGANDGMLHAFTGGTGTNAGRELFAYVPSVLFSRDPGDATNPADGLLAQLGKPLYAHRNYVDATPQVFDIDFLNAGGAFANVTNAQGVTSSDWRSVLIGGLGKGGRSYYAIDVSDPSVMTSEAAVAGKVLWEFPGAANLPTAAGGTCNISSGNCVDMGYSFGDPVVVKTAKYGWVALFTSGYNNQDGKGWLFVVDPRNGRLLEKVSTGTQAADGMARPTAYVRDFADFTADSVYVGDLSGQVWRFDLTSPRGGAAYPAPTRIAVLKDASNATQPITTAPLVEVHPVTRQRYVLVGTGRLLDRTDLLSGQNQSFYALIDGGIAAFATAGADGQAYPVDLRSRLAAVTATNATNDPNGGTLATAPDLSGKAGWYIDLGTTGSVGWRLITPPTAFSGLVAFSSTLPTGDACNPDGQSRIYALNYAKATSVLDSTVAYIPQGAIVTELSFYNVKGKPRLIAGSSAGGISAPSGVFWAFDPRQLGWREVGTVK
ncbi:PilC/PilY family type IV pilus protein [uncultured Pseudacidovorax sp.]|uniref:PilC/PilY family type IV pilus protein n=1 Tax=uncultured Pseudacidovorax sp. TaxID=679313 RepID=UPI0025DA38A5|nr:PilC/PilY family type IV pilus protein [uncultured Pseudacidovorax sp.]